MAKVVKVTKKMKGKTHSFWNVDARSIGVGQISQNPNTNERFESKKEAQAFLDDLIAEIKKGYNVNVDKLTIEDLCEPGELVTNPTSNSGIKNLINGGEYIKFLHTENYSNLERIGLGQLLISHRALKKLYNYCDPDAKIHKEHLRNNIKPFCSDKKIILWKDLNPKKFLDDLLKFSKENAKQKEDEDLMMASAWSNFDHHLIEYKHLSKWISINKKCNDLFSEIITSNKYGSVTFQKPKRLDNLQKKAKDNQVSLNNVNKVRDYMDYAYQQKNLKYKPEYAESRRRNLFLQFDLIKSIGLRIGEAVALTWDDINDDEIRINKQYHYLEKTIKETKNNHREEFIYVSDDIAKRLQEHKNSQTENEKTNNLVFPNTEGNYDSRRTLYKEMKKASKEVFGDTVSLHVTPHTLRHLFATEMIRQGGADYLPMVSEILRHSSGTKFTKKQYVHVLKKSDKLIKIQKDRVANLYT